MQAHRLIADAAELSRSEGRRLLTAWLVAELAAPAVGLGAPELSARLSLDEAVSLALGRDSGTRTRMDHYWRSPAQSQCGIGRPSGTREPGGEHAMTSATAHSM